MLTGVTVQKSKYQYYSEGMDLSELILLVLMSSLFLDRMILNKKMVQLDFRIKIQEEGGGGGDSNKQFVQNTKTPYVFPQQLLSLDKIL